MLSESAKKIEAILYLYPSPCSYVEVMEKASIHSNEELDEAIDLLIKDYDERGSALEIVRKDKFIFIKLKDRYKELVKKMVNIPFTEKQLKLLIFVMFREPVKQKDIISALGKSYIEVLQELKKMKYIRVVKEGRIDTLYVSDKFYKLYGVESRDKMLSTLRIEKDKV